MPLRDHVYIKVPEDKLGILDSVEKGLIGIKEISQAQPGRVRRTSRKL